MVPSLYYTVVGRGDVLDLVWVVSRDGKVIGRATYLVMVLDHSLNQVFMRRPFFRKDQIAEGRPLFSRRNSVTKPKLGNELAMC